MNDYPLGFAGVHRGSVNLLVITKAQEEEGREHRTGIESKRDVNLGKRKFPGWHLCGGETDERWVGIWEY